MSANKMFFLEKFSLSLAKKINFQIEKPQIDFPAIQ